MERFKKYFGDAKWIIAIASVIYALCVHLYTIEGLPARVSKLEAWRVEAEKYHHNTELVLTQINTTLLDIKTQLTFLRGWMINDRAEDLQ